MIIIPTSDAGFLTGYIAMFGAEVPPAGWALCDGAELDRAANTGLFAVLGEMYGIGDGVTTFNLPDLRGEFIRGLDEGRGVDVGRVDGSNQSASTAAPTTAMSTDEEADHVHLASTTSAGDHNHLEGDATANAGDSNGYFGYGYGGNNGPTTLNLSSIANILPYLEEVDWAHGHAHSTGWGGIHSHILDAAGFDDETRPKNIAISYIIKL